MSDPPKFTDLQRSLAMLRRLQIQPLRKAELVAAVRAELGHDVYPAENQVNKLFERDLKRLREWGAVIEPETGHYYHLKSYGDFSPVALAPEELGALAFLAETFGGDAPQADGVQRLLRRVLDWLTAAQREAAARQQRRLRVDLRRRDNEVVDPAVEAAVDKALAERRRLRFLYLSPSQEDGIPRDHTVEPYSLRYDTLRHHVYLDAYRIKVSGPKGEWLQPRWQHYRLGRILPEGIQVLPDKLPPTIPKRPAFALDYLLAPEIARTGQVSRHFDPMTVHPPDAAGWVRVTATTDDLFSAMQLLLGYGPRCRVVGGPELRRMMAEAAVAMAAYYGSASTNADAAAE